jgi:hypothetical protein
MACLKELILSSCKIKHYLCIVIQDPVTLLGYVDQVTLSKIAMIMWLEFGEF